MRLSKFVLVCGVVALMAAPALAQRQPGGGFGGRGGAMSTTQLLQNKSVQEELKLDKDQLTKIDEAVKKVRDDESLKDAFATQRDRQAKPDERAAAQKKINDANTKAVSGILKADQEKRLTQIHHQVMGLAIFTDEETSKALKLTDDQKEKIKEVSDTLGKDMQDLRPMGGTKPDAATMAENMKKMQSLRKEAMASATKVLKPDQKTTLKEMTGEPFEIKMEFGGGKPGTKPTDKPRNDF